MKLNDFKSVLKVAKVPIREKKLVKKGTLCVGVVETTPVVWKGQLYRFEWIRNGEWGCYKGEAAREVGSYHFVNMETGEETPEFGFDHSFGCCYTDGTTMFVHGVRGPGGGQHLDTFWSTDLIHWEQAEALAFPSDINLYNTSVCKGADAYYIAIEIGGSHPVVGKAFTCVFAKSSDLIHWELLPMERYVYSPDRYTACPVIRYVNGQYYMIYLERVPCHRWYPYIVRTPDFENWELGLRNPICVPDDDDKKLVVPEAFSEEEKSLIFNAADTNNSDFDLCEYNGKTVILYSWGNQLSAEFLGLAEYDGSMAEFLESHFPTEKEFNEDMVRQASKYKYLA